MREDEIRSLLRTRLGAILPEATPIRITAPEQARQDDTALNLEVKGHQLRMMVEIVGQPNLARLREKFEALRERARKARGIPVVVAPFLNSQMRKRCEDSGVQYLDLSGNVWLETPSIFIRKEVAKNLYPHQAKRRSPFADRASLILRYLLAEPGPATMSRLASATHLDSGYVSRIIRSAADLRYATIDSDGRVRLINQEEMLGDWAAGYGWRRNPCVSYFTKEPTESFAERLRDVLSQADETKYALTLHGGNNLVAPFASYGIWHLYIGDPAVERRLVDGLRLERAPQDAGNVNLLTPYYRSSVFFNAHAVKGLRVVSDVQLFLDLRHYPVRGVEAGEEILTHRLRPSWSAP